MLLLEKLELNEIDIVQASEALNNMKPGDLSGGRYFTVDIEINLNEEGDLDGCDEILMSIDKKDQI